MVQPVIDSLIEFSKAHNLWQTTKKCGFHCLENWMKESPDECAQLFPELTPANFRFEDVSQSVIFFQHEKKAFILRTRYSLFTDRQKNNNVAVGWYALDVNEEGEIIDDFIDFA